MLLLRYCRYYEHNSGFIAACAARNTTCTVIDFTADSKQQPAARATTQYVQIKLSAECFENGMYCHDAIIMKQYTNDIATVAEHVNFNYL